MGDWLLSWWLGAQAQLDAPARTLRHSMIICRVIVICFALDWLVGRHGSGCGEGEAVDVAMGVVAMGMAIDLLEQVFCS